jgi:hypothetical protein
MDQNVYLHLWRKALGRQAIMMPVISVGFLSIAASLDIDARIHTADEMPEFLASQRERLLQASTQRELAILFTQTESRLLGETAAWHSRRSFRSVA